MVSEIVVQEPQEGEGFALVEGGEFSDEVARLIFTDGAGNKKHAGNILSIRHGDDGYFIDLYGSVRYENRYREDNEFDIDSAGRVRVE